MEGEHGPAWGLMGEIKRLFDPNGILNPGKIVPDPPAPLDPALLRTETV